MVKRYQPSALNRSQHSSHTPSPQPTIMSPIFRRQTSTPTVPTPRILLSSRSATTQRFIREVIVERRTSDNLFNIQIEEVGGNSAAQCNERVCKLRVQGPGFLTDDRLLSLNGRQLSQNTDAVRVNRIIRSLAGKTLTVQVLSVVSTIVNHSTGGGSESSGTASTPNAVRVSIKRFGTVKNANHILQDVTKQNISSLYWMVNEAQVPSYSLVQLHREVANNSAVVSRVSMPLQTFEAGIDRLEKANFPEFDMSDQLSNLQFINESSLLHVLRTRYISSYPFTAIGTLLVALPPSDKKDEYWHVPQLLKEIAAFRSERAPPHILSSVLQLYRDAICEVQEDTQHSLCIIGQAESSKKILSRRAHLALCLLANKRKDTNALTNAVQSFCDVLDLLSCSCYHSGNYVNSSLQQNTASLTKFKLNNKGHVCSVKLELYLSDRSALFYHRRGASIFGLLCAVAHCDDVAIRTAYTLDQAVKAQGSKHIFLNSIDNGKCAHLWHMLTGAFEQLNISQNDQDTVISLCAVILHIGSCDATKLSGISLQRAQTVCQSMSGFNHAARIFGVHTEEFISTVFHGVGHDVANAQIDTDSDITPLKCICGIAIALYETLVTVLVNAINLSFSRIVSDVETTSAAAAAGRSMRKFYSTVNIINAPPLSSSSKRGCFPQFINNYFAEKLHSVISNVKYAQALNNLSKEFPSYQANHDWCNWKNKSFKNLQQLMENLNCSQRMKEAGIKGLMWMLDHSFLSHEEIISTISSSQYANQNVKNNLQTPLISILARPAVFRIAHFGGYHSIAYDPADWFAVHRELPRPPLLNALFECSEKANMRSVSAMSREFKCKDKSFADSSLHSTAGRLLAEMETLLNVVRQSSSVAPVYCLSPNEHQDAKTQSLDDVSVRRQMRMFELVSACRVFKSLLCQHISHEKLMGNFSAISPDIDIKFKMHSCSNKTEAVQLLMDGFKLGNQSYSCGKSGVYMRLSTLQDLEFKRDDRVHTVVSALQCIIRGCLARTMYERKKLQLLAITHIQRNGRVYLKIKQWEWWRLFNKLRSVAPVYSFENRIIELESELAATKKSLSKAVEECKSVKNLNIELERVLEENEEKKLRRGYEWNKTKDDDGDAAVPPFNEQLDGSEMCKLRCEIENLKKLVLHRTERIAELENELRNAPTSKSPFSDNEEEDELKQLTLRLVESEKAQSNLKNELFDLRFENEVKSDRISDLEAHQAKYDEEISSLAGNVDEWKCSYEKVVEEKNELVKEMEQMRLVPSSLNDSVNAHVELRESRQDSCSSTATTGSAFNTVEFGSDEVAVCLLSKTRSKIRSLENKIDDLEAELDEQNIAMQSNEQARAKAELQLQQERKKHCLEIEKLEDELDSARSNFQRRLKFEEDKLEEEILNSSNLRKQLRTAEMKLSENTFLDGSSCSASSISKQCSSSSSSLVNQLRKRVAQYKALLNDAHLQLEQSRSELSADSQQHSFDQTTTNNNSSSGGCISGGTMMSKDREIQLRNQIDDLEHEKSTIQRALTNARNQLAETSEEVDYLKCESAKNEENVRFLQQQNADLLDKLDCADEDNSELVKKVDELSNGNSQAQKLIGSLKFDVGRLEVDNKRLSGRCEELERRISELEDDLLSKRILSSATIETDSKIADLENRARKETLTAQRLQHQVERLKEQSEKYKCSEMSALTRIQTLELDLTQANGKVRRYADDLESANQSLSRLQQERSKTSSAITRAEAEVASLQAKLRLAHDRIQLLQNALKAETIDEEDEDDTFYEGRESTRNQQYPGDSSTT